MDQTRKYDEYEIDFANADRSDAISVQDYAAIALYVPAAAVSITAVAYETDCNGVWAPIAIDGVAVSDTVAPGSLNVLNVNLFPAIGRIRLVLSAAATATCRLHCKG